MLVQRCLPLADGLHNHDEHNWDAIGIAPAMRLFGAIEQGVAWRQPELLVPDFKLERTFETEDQLSAGVGHHPSPTAGSGL